MRTIAADYIFTEEDRFIPKGIIHLNDEGEILNIIDTHGNLQESENLEYYNGILIPGFVNAHCHLELSHMKSMITPGTKLHGFVTEIIAKRFKPENLSDILARADAELRAEGVVAVGDISNADDTFDLKRESSIYYHTFIELFTGKSSEIPAILNRAVATKKAAGNLPANFVPHAAYSVPPALLEAIHTHNDEDSVIISVHNQETAGETELFTSQSGPLREALQRIGFDYTDYDFSGKNSIQSYLPKLPDDKNILLIHNIFTKADDIKFAENHSDSIYWVFCPASNLYIEDRLPDIPIFYDMGVKTCIGTDSYASNTKLSILHELKIIHHHYPEIPLVKLLDSACINGAEALNIQDTFGSLTVGKRPGVNLLTNIDYDTMQLTDESDVRVLV